MSESEAWKICEYHGQTFIWTLRHDGWSRGGYERFSLAQVVEIDGPLKAMDYIGTAEAILAEVASLTAERDRLQAHILDIDAHATPYGDLPEEPGFVGTYLLTAGALHRALGTVGHGSPSCAAEAELERQRPVIKAARAWRGQPWLTHGASRSVKFTSALAAAVDALDDAPGEATP